MSCSHVLVLGVMKGRNVEQKRMIGWTEVEGEAEGPIRLNEMNRKGKKERDEEVGQVSLVIQL